MPRGILFNVFQIINMLLDSVRFHFCVSTKRLNFASPGGRVLLSALYDVAFLLVAIYPASQAHHFLTSYTDFRALVLSFVVLAPALLLDLHLPIFDITDTNHLVTLSYLHFGVVLVTRAAHVLLTIAAVMHGTWPCLTCVTRWSFFHLINKILNRNVSFQISHISILHLGYRFA